MKVDGNMDLKVIMLEMTLTHLYVSMTLKKIQVTVILQKKCSTPAVHTV